MEKDTEVINSHLAADAVKKRDSNPIDSRSNSRGMQDNYHNARKHVGWSKGQLFKGPPNEKQTRDGESGPSHAGTPHNNHSNLQGPQRRYTKGSQGPPYPPKLVTQKSFGLSKGSKVQITPLLPPQNPLPSTPLTPTHTPNHPTTSPPRGSTAPPTTPTPKVTAPPH